tara:strand:+ start:115095 stop:115925 length:831 start_codon:yes stop_codon:yes gene_type:complete
MARRTRTRKLIGSGLAIFAIFGVMIASQYIPRDTPLFLAVSDKLAPVMTILRSPVIAARQLDNQATKYFNTVETNERLRLENARLMAWRDEALYLRDENKHLKTLLDMAADLEVNPVAGRVLADTRSPYARSVLVDVGADKGIEKGQAVLSEEGLAGRILEVAPSSSRVLLLTDHNARIPVKLLESGLLAVVRGGNARKLELILVDSRVQAKEGELVVTSGVGGVFAPGIPVAKVVSTGEIIKVQPLTNFAKLDRVVIHKRPTMGIVTFGGEATDE